MRSALLISLFVASAHAAAQTPAPTPTPPPATEAPAKPQTRKPPARPAAAARTTLMITATAPDGRTLPGVRVELLGAADRSGDTDESGTLRLTNVRAGTYRVRFSGPGIITFEREAVIRAGQTVDLDVTLHPAPEPEPAPEPPPEQPQPSAAVGVPGEPTVHSILDLLEKDFIGRQPRKETLLGCSVNLRSMMIQLNDPLPERLYESAEAAYYVLGGEGTIRLNGRESPIVTGSFAMVPRGTAHAFVRKGRRPLILLSLLSGEACPSTQ